MPNKINQSPKRIKKITMNSEDSETRIIKSLPQSPLKKVAVAAAKSKLVSTKSTSTL